MTQPILRSRAFIRRCVRWNRENGGSAAVCYGIGVSFGASAPSPGNIVTQLRWDGALIYYGDIDPKGLMIPLRASKTLEEFGLPGVSPQFGCYRRLLERAEEIDLPHVGILAFPSECAKWLGVLADDVKGWFQEGFRIPQELVEYEQLVRGVEVACGVPEDDQ